jgi:D-alanyl-D-alanine dipeptidase
MTAFGAFEELRHRPIPDQAAARAARKDCRKRIPINQKGTLFGEVMLEARREGLAGENYYHAPRNPPYWRPADGSIPELWLRKTLIEKLQALNARIGMLGLEVFLFDGWRPRAVQAYFHDVWMPAELQRRNPALTGAALTAEVETYWAAPSQDKGSPAPHETGGAVDLTLRWRDGQHLWMGSIFDDVTAMAHRDRFEAAGGEGLSYSDEEARANRRLLHWLMVDEGFAAHPDEWWHFSYGDQMWAALSGAPAALYGVTAPAS